MSSAIEEETPSKLYICTVGIILIFSGIMRFKGLDTESMWLDELTSLWAINGDSWEGAMSNWFKNSDLTCSQPPFFGLR